jgi:hypothetical protein
MTCNGHVITWHYMTLHDITCIACHYMHNKMLMSHKSIRGSHVYEANTWLWNFGRPQPSVASLSVAKTEKICKRSQCRGAAAKSAWNTWARQAPKSAAEADADIWHLNSCQLWYHSFTRYHSSWYRCFTDITVTGLQYQSHWYRWLRYHITQTLISQYQNSNIDCYIRSTVISEFKTVISQQHTSNIRVNIGCDIGCPDITADCIRYLSHWYHSTSDIIITDITVTLILLLTGGLLAPTLKGGSPLSVIIYDIIPSVMIS